MAEFYTYLHCKPDGTPFYVGKGTGYRSHDLGHRTNYHKNIVAKYGRGNIGIFVFQCESEKQALADEIQQVAQLRREGYKLVNLTDGGDGTSGRVPTAEHRAKASMSNRGQGRGRKLSPDVCMKMSIARKGKARTYLSEVARERIGAAQRGKITSDAVRLKISAATKQAMQHPDVRAKMCKPKTKKET